MLEGVEKGWSKYLKNHDPDRAGEGLINSWLNNFCVKGSLDGVNYPSWEEQLKNIGANK
ncbi:MAG: hypothetical protein R2747_00345 [Pyrinomonadaceae bacterium]